MSTISVLLFKNSMRLSIIIIYSTSKVQQTREKKNHTQKRETKKHIIKNTTISKLESKIVAHMFKTKLTNKSK